MKLRWYQEESVKAVWQYMRAERGNPLIVLPTGSGKSLCIAELARQAVTWGGRVIVLAHRKELLEQNADKIRALLPGVDVGIYSAGLKSRDTDHDIVCAGIQSAFRKAFDFGERKLVIIDESHLVPNNDVGMYREFIDTITKGNQWIRFVGLTATPYRLQDGMLTDGDIWSEIVYNAPIRQMIAEGYLCPLTNSGMKASIDTRGLHTRGGEFIPREMEGEFLRGDKVAEVAREIIASVDGRKSILVFGAGVDHAHSLARTLHDFSGEEVACITGDTLPIERQSSIEAFRNGSLRWLVNMDVLTVGFDAPNIDCIAVVRATKSAGLFAQIVGRGFRICEGKEDCQVLDFGGNLKRHGPLDSPSYGKHKYGDDDAGDQVLDSDTPFKKCPQCKAEQHPSNRWCDACNFKFPEPEKNHETEADNESAILSEPITRDVLSVNLLRHAGRNGKQDTLRVDYEIDNLSPNRVSEWICVEHAGWPGEKACNWWKEHTLAPLGDIDECIDWWKRHALRMPVRITIHQDGRWWRVDSREFEDERPEEALDEAVEDGELFADDEIPF